MNHAKNYDVVIINISHGETRNEKGQFKTVRRMLTWSHYSFQQQLKHKAEEIGMKNDHTEQIIYFKHTEYRREKSL
jgi:transposase